MLTPQGETFINILDEYKRNVRAWMNGAWNSYADECARAGMPKVRVSLIDDCGVQFEAESDSAVLLAAQHELNERIKAIVMPGMWRVWAEISEDGPGWTLAMVMK